MLAAGMFSGLTYYKDDDFSSIQLVGEGNFSKVYKVVLKSSGAKRALKVSKDPPTAENIAEWIAEVRILQ